MQFGSSPTKDSVIRIKRFRKEDIKIYFLKKKGKEENAKIIQSWVFCSPLMWVVVSEISSLHRSCGIHAKSFGPSQFFFFSWDINVHSFTCCGVMCLTLLLSLVWSWSCVLPTQRGEKCTGRVQRQTMNLTPQEKKNLSCLGNFVCILGNHINYWSLTSQTDSRVWVFARLLKMQ